MTARRPHRFKRRMLALLFAPTFAIGTNTIPAIGTLRVAAPVVSARSQTNAPVGAPAWIKPGTRISWTGGQSLRGSPNPSSGGGITQLTVVALTPTSALVQTELFGDDGANVSSESLTSLDNVSPLKLNASDNEFWKNPAVLAGMKNSSTDGLTVNRVQFQIAKQTFRALTIRSTAKNGGHYDQTFDLVSGIMLGQSWEYPHDDGSVTSGYSQYSRQRTMKLPWNINSAPPQWAASAVLEYAGQFVIRTPGVDDLPFPLSFSLTYKSSGPNWFSHQKKSADTPRGAETLTLSSGVWPIGYWLPPDGLRSLQPGTVIDFDRTTKMQLSVGTNRDRTISLVATNGNQESEFRYDIGTGVLISFDTEVARPVNTRRSVRLKKLPV